MRVAFRVDVSMKIGTGHFMRCITLADGLRGAGIKIAFICRDLPDHFIDLLDQKGYEYIPVTLEDFETPKNYNAIDNLVSDMQFRDAGAVIKILAHHTWDWLIVDHYSLDFRWEDLVRKKCKKLLVIDDLADRSHNCDLLLDQNLFPDIDTRYLDRAPISSQLLLGPKYALLRKEFLESRKWAQIRSGKVKRILIFFGGIDEDNFTSMTITALTNLNLGIHIDVVIGDQHPFRDQIQAACIEQGYHCHVQTYIMHKFMAMADFSIGAGGSASWERCSLGLPALVVAVAKNQIEIAKMLDSIGACIYVGTKDTVNLKRLQNEILAAIATKDRLREMSRIALSLVDGLGVKRVCQNMGF